MTFHVRKLAFSSSCVSPSPLAYPRPVPHTMDVSPVLKRAKQNDSTVTCPDISFEDSLPDALDEQRDNAQSRKPKVSRLDVPFVGSGRRETVAGRQQLLSHHLKVLIGQFPTG